MVRAVRSLPVVFYLVEKAGKSDKREAPPVETRPPEDRSSAISLALLSRWASLNEMHRASPNAGTICPKIGDLLYHFALAPFCPSIT